jgi:branched-chain amino acid transport system substrate-binding protein
VKIGVLTDFTGPYAAWGAKGSVLAAEMAAEDFKKAHPSFPYKIEIVSADFQLKSDVAVSISRKWIEEGVNAIVDMPHTATALAVNSLVKGTATAALISGSASNDLTTKFCSPNMVQWTYDQYSIGTPTFSTVVKGGKWFFIVQDSIAGRAFEDIAKTAIERTGGKLLEVVRTPTGTADYSGPLVQARASKADGILLGAAGGDLINALKQAHEFGIVNAGQKLALGFVLLPDVKGIGLATAQGLTFTEAFYWDLDDRTRGFSKRFADRYEGKPPTSVQAGAYSAVTHYLKGVEAAKSTNGPAAIAKMKELPVDDAAFGQGKLRADGRMVHNHVLVEVKKPSESKGPWDYYKLRATIPADEAFRPMADGGCPLVKS